jgi:hypothetical protein
MYTEHNPNIDDEILDVEAAAKVCCTTVDAMYKYAQRKVVPSHKRGRRRLFLKSELIAYIKSL